MFIDDTFIFSNNPMKGNLFRYHNNTVAWWVKHLKTNNPETH